MNTSTILPTATSALPRAWRSPLPVLMAGIFLIVLDFFVVNVALASIQADLHASSTAIEWIVAGYGLTFAVPLLGAGRLGDRFGRRRVFTVGIGLFTLSSAVCGFATSATTLVAARLVQGAAAALISVTVLALIGVIYTGAARAHAISCYATAMGVAAASAQLIGGVLVSADVAGLGWRSVFLVNVPIGLAALLLTPRLIPESRADHPGRMDVAGLLLVTAGLTVLVLPLLDGRQHGWPPWTWLALAAAPVLLGGFLLRQRSLAGRGEQPLLDPRLFRSRSFSAGLAAQLVLWCGQASYFVVLALYLQQGRGLSPLRAGLVFTILAGAYLIASTRSPTLTARFGRLVVTGGALLLAAGHAALLLATIAYGVAGSVFILAPGLAFTGAGMGLCIPALTGIILHDADPQQSGAVSGALSTVQQVGNAVGVAVIGLIFFPALSRGYDHAFELSEAVLAALLIVLAVLTVLLPSNRSAEGQAARGRTPARAGSGFAAHTAEDDVVGGR
jgi:EmrB/QacA subfamily drug resistance transporter